MRGDSWAPVAAEAQDHRRQLVERRTRTDKRPRLCSPGSTQMPIPGSAAAKLKSRNELTEKEPIPGWRKAPRPIHRCAGGTGVCGAVAL
jgi:hypothetical protein